MDFKVQIFHPSSAAPHPPADYVYSFKQESSWGSTFRPDEDATYRFSCTEREWLAGEDLYLLAITSRHDGTLTFERQAASALRAASEQLIRQQGGGDWECSYAYTIDGQDGAPVDRMQPYFTMMSLRKLN